MVSRQYRQPITRSIEHSLVDANSYGLRYAIRILTGVTQIETSRILECAVNIQPKGTVICEVNNSRQLEYNAPLATIIRRTRV